MTQPTHPDLLATIDALLLTVAMHPGMVEAPNGERWRGALGVLRELAQEQEAIARIDKDLKVLMQDISDNFSSLVETLSALRNEYADLTRHVEELEAWRDAMTGDGR